MNGVENDYQYVRREIHVRKPIIICALISLWMVCLHVVVCARGHALFIELLSIVRACEDDKPPQHVLFNMFIANSSLHGVGLGMY